MYVGLLVSMYRPELGVIIYNLVIHFAEMQLGLVKPCCSLTLVSTLSYTCLNITLPHGVHELRNVIYILNCC